ncbi:hypothetical protein LXL04_029226 [Taraxacum kok-saghyz]
MVGTSIHHNLCLPHPQQHHQNQKPIDPTSREQECIYHLKKCKNMEDLKQSHSLILKLGLLSSSFCTSNLISISALSHFGSMDYACSIFHQIDCPNSFQFNTMIRGHIKDTNLDEAIVFYNQMLEMGIHPNNFTYPSLLKGCSYLQRLEEGMQLHGHVFKTGLQDDVFVQNSLINMYGKCREITKSCTIFNQMEDLDRNSATWSTIMSAYVNKEMWGECLEMFRELSSRKDWRAEESILVSVLSSCINLNALDLGRSTHGFLIRNLSGLNVIIETTLLDFYLKGGFLETGLLIFERMKVKNQWSYSVMISGLAFHGYGTEALRVFSEMREKGFEPDGVVYISVLTACSHAGLVKDGFTLFEKMKEDKIEPTIEHYGCLVDAMGKVGKVREAFEFIKSMPMEANEVILYSLLGACWVHQDLELGVKIGKKVVELNPQTNGAYVILSNIYAKSQRWELVGLTRKEIAQNAVKTHGFSFIEVKRKVYKFVSNDILWAKCEGVSNILTQMQWQLKFEGYFPDLSEVLHDVDEDEKRERLSRHSQKLAIAFGLIHTSKDSSIRIVRTMRMCKDCHTFTKMISSIYERRIVVRDRNRFHCFENGACSCKDYW